MQEICSTQQCTNNTTLSSQQMHRRSSVSDLLSKYAKQKVTVPSPPCLLCKGDYYARGGGVAELSASRWGNPFLEAHHFEGPAIW